MQMSVVQPNQQNFWVRRVFPWFSDNQTNWLYDEVGKLGIADESERLAKEQEIYKQALPIIRQRQAEAEIADVQNWRYSKALGETDPKKKQVAMAEYRISEVAGAIKRIKWIPATAPEDEVYAAYLKENPSDSVLIENYVNKWDKEILYKMWVEERPLGNKIGSFLWGAAAVVGGWLWAMYGAGEAWKYLSKGIYNAVTPKTKSEIDAVSAFKSKETDVKPNRVVDNMLETPMIQEWWRGAARLWFVWSRSAQMEQAKVFRKNIRKEIYDPAFKAMDKKGIKGDYRLLREKTLEKIDKMEWISESDKRLAKKRANQIFNDHYQWNFGKDAPSMRNLNKEAKTVKNKLPKNFPEWGLAGNDINIARTAIKDTFKEEVWTKGKKVWYDLKDADIKYGSVAEIIKEGKAAAAKPLLRWGLPFGIIWNVSNAATPVIGSTVWKLWYKLSEAVQYIPKALWENAKEFVKSGNAKALLKQSLRETPASILTPTWEDAVREVNEYQSNKLETAIQMLESWKMPTRKQDPIIHALIKDMTPEEALKELKELQALRSKKWEFKDGLDYLLKVIEKEAGDSFTPYMKKK